MNLEADAVAGSVDEPLPVALPGNLLSRAPIHRPCLNTRAYGPYGSLLGTLDDFMHGFDLFACLFADDRAGDVRAVAPNTASIIQYYRIPLLDPSPTCPVVGKGAVRSRCHQRLEGDLVGSSFLHNLFDPRSQGQLGHPLDVHPRNFLESLISNGTGFLEMAYLIRCLPYPQALHNPGAQGKLRSRKHLPQNEEKRGPHAVVYEHFNRSRGQLRQGSLEKRFRILRVLPDAKLRKGRFLLDLPFVELRDEEDAVFEDRAEIYFCPDAGMKDYYAIEVDARGRTFDYRASYYRRLDTAWNWEGLETKASPIEQGYVVEGRIPLASFEAMGFPRLRPGVKIRGGLYRAEFSHDRSGRKVEQRESIHNQGRQLDGPPPIEAWMSWVDPKTVEPDFHVPTSLGWLEIVE